MSVSQPAAASHRQDTSAKITSAEKMNIHQTDGANAKDTKTNLTNSLASLQQSRVRTEMVLSQNVGKG